MSGDGVKTPKKWWKSKMMIVNGVATAVTVVNQIAPILPPNVQAGIAVALPIINMGLRLVTHQPIGA